MPLHAQTGTITSWQVVGLFAHAPCVAVQPMVGSSQNALLPQES
jgi:hypothetical protein